MSEKQFERWNDHSCKVKDNQENTFLNWEDVVNKLNEQQATISQLQKKVSEYELLYNSCSMQRDEFFRGATENAKLVGEQQATIDKLDQENADLLGARIKAQEEWEKCTDKLKEKILEQQATINKLKEEEKLYAQEILRLNELLKQYQANQDLGGGY